MVKSKQSLPACVMRRLRGRPYYAYLYARNVLGGRLPASLEMDLVHDPQSAYLYAKHVMGGRLPDCVHAGLVMYSLHKRDEAGGVALYLKFLEGR